MEVDTKELAVVKTQVSKAVAAAEAITIASLEDLTKATDLLSKIKQVGKMLTEKKSAITAPLNEALKNVRGLFAPIETQYAEAERIVKDKMLGYQRDVDRKATEERARLAARVDRGTMKFETAAKKSEAIQTVDRTVEGKTAGAAVQFRTVKEVILSDASKLPAKYLLPDMVAIRKDALAGVVIPGVEVVEKQTIAAH